MQQKAIQLWPPFIEWPGLTPYDVALARMDEKVAECLKFRDVCPTDRPLFASESVIFCQHPLTITVGTSGNADAEIINSNAVIYPTNRGGKTTCHEPGQRVVYPILDLDKPGMGRGRDLRAYVQNLQRWLIESLKDVGVNAYASDDIGVWVKSTQPHGKEEKIAAIGIRVRRWVAFHGIAINVTNNLDGFCGIVPCGIKDKGVTSLKKLGVDIDMATFDTILLKHFARTFGAPVEE